MISCEKNVINSSPIYIHTPSSIAKKTFIYLLRTGHFYYAPGYYLKRSSFDSYEIIYVVDGIFEINVGNSFQKCKKGDLIIIDCYKPHEYKSTEGCETYWVHYDGVMARDLFNLITTDINKVIRLKHTYSIEKNILRIFNMFHVENAIKEPLISNYIINILTELIMDNQTKSNSKNHEAIVEEAISYINENLNKNLSVEEIAERFSFSPYYFIRIFKKATGFTLHEYINESRINTAKFYLKTTDTPIKEICYNVGFSSESNFCTAFKKHTGTTPREYRTTEKK